MKVETLNGQVLIKELPKEEKTASGIYIHSKTAEPDSPFGVVLEVQKGSPVKRGDQVVFNKRDAFAVKVGQEMLYFLHESDILGVIRE